MDEEMRKALEADGEKLRQLTGEDHGPVFVPVNAAGETRRCPECGAPGRYVHGWACQYLNIGRLSP